MEYKYYAFISYSRKNSKSAKYLHKQLEHFRVPIKYVSEENRPAGQKFLRPIFRDRRDLEAGEGSFTNDIKIAIEQSRYMIVLCSPESAASHWVNEEIKHFLATHHNDYNAIVPVILNGEPGSGGDTECLPEVLRCEEVTMRNLPTMIPDDGDDEKIGWENGVVQVMSYMLKVNREKIKATVDAEKVRQAKIYAVIGIVATIIFALLAGWAVRAERQAIVNEQRAIAGEKLAQENNMALSYNNIGCVYDAQGDYLKALEYLHKSLAIREKVFGEEHPDVAISYNNIGGVYFNQGDYAKALEYFQKSLAILEMVFGQEHPDVVQHYVQIGFVYIQLGKKENAKEYLEKTLSLCLKVFGQEHPWTKEVQEVLDSIE